MEKLTIDELHRIVSWMQSNIDSCISMGALSLAAAIEDRVEPYKIELIGRITAEDPYTTEADVRYFENIS